MAIVSLSLLHIFFFVFFKALSIYNLSGLPRTALGDFAVVVTL